MIIKHFEEKIQTLFEHAIASLPPMEMWSMERNVYSFQRRAEADILIKKGGINYAIVEVKGSLDSQTFERARMQARFTATLFFTPFYIVVTPKKYALYQSDGKLIRSESLEINELSVRALLTDQKPEKFNTQKWKDAIDGIDNEVENSKDQKLNRAEIRKILERLKYAENYNVDDITRKIKLTPETEQKLYDALLGKYTGDLVCRFTTLNSIFRTVSTGKQSMSSIVAMNDKSETSYVIEYFNTQTPDLISNLQSGPSDWNNSFITSCCDIDRENDFTMLRLYADDAKGVCIRYNVLPLSKFPGFILNKVSYQRQDGTHPELDVIIKLLQININGYTLTLPGLSIWQHFFKPKEYEFEKEVRLLYRIDKKGIQPDESFWILNSEFNIVCPLVNFAVSSAKNTYPLQLERVTLGPKMLEADINSKQLTQMLTGAPLSPASILNGANVTVTVSPITHYR